MKSWLETIGLGHLAARFAAEHIGLDDRQSLTEDDLRELGLSLGDRLRWRRALASLASGPEGSSAADHASVDPTVAERRPLTLMFVDLVDSSGIAERLEAEDLLGVIDRYRSFCHHHITRFGGYVARVVGDGILAYFCYPVANENDPERAVRAALDITRAADDVKLPDGTPIGIRIGIATGRVIVSDLSTGDTTDRASIVGSAPNLAARLQALAPVNGVVIAASTHARVETRFECESLGAQNIRGFTAQITAWLVKREIVSDGMVGDHHPPRLTSLFGRSAEIERLQALWMRAAEGSGSVVLVTGEAGIGKSRLVEHFVERCLPHPARVIRVGGSEFHENTPFAPCMDHLRSVAKMVPDDPPETKLEKLRAVLLGSEAERARILPLLGQLFDIPVPQRQTLSPEQFRAQILVAMSEQILRQADTVPLCLVVEDIHWLDPSTHELLAHVEAAAPARRMLVLLTAREGEAGRWSDRSGICTMALSRLTPNDAGAMVASIFGEIGVPPALAAEITNKTDGVPLFVEEVGRAILQQRDELGSDLWRESLVDELIEAVPESLQESFTSRLDRSGPAKEIAQIAAVGGRSGRRDVLARVSELRDADLDAALRRLTQAGIMHPEASDGVVSYSFNHALLRDVAYDSLLRDRRMQLHRRLASAMRELGLAARDLEPEILAHHLAEAGDTAEAAEYWLEAGLRSIKRSALTEASRLLTRGFSALKLLPSTQAVVDLKLRFAGLLGPVLIGLKGPGSEEAQEVYREFYNVCADLPEHATHFPIYWGWWRVSRDFYAQLDRSAVLLRRAEENRNPEFMLQAHHCNWASHYHAGDFCRCLDHIDAGIAIYDQGEYRHHASFYGNHDPKVCGLGERAQAMWMLGRSLTALRDERRSVSWADSIDHLGSRVHAMDFRLLHRVYRREYGAVARQADHLIGFTTAAGLMDHRAKGMIFSGWALAMSGDEVAKGLAMLEAGLARQRENGTTEDFPIYLCMLTEVLLAAGRPDRAYEEQVAARTLFDSIGLRVWDSEVLRMTAEARMAAGADGLDEADTLLAEASTIAAMQGAFMLSLRVEQTRARLDLAHDRQEGAWERLSTALSRLPEREASQTAEATALLQRLAPSRRPGPAR